MSNNTGLNFCRRCGNSLTGRTRFCGYCGTLIMSTAFAPAKKHPFAQAGGLVVLAGMTIVFGMYVRPVHQRVFAQPASPPFLEPGPPADLITMLQRGFSFREDVPLPIEGMAIVMKDLCHVILTDYPSNSYAYGPTTDAAQQARVEGEAESLVEQVSTLFTDKTQARHKAEFVLAGQAIQLYEQRQMDPGQACQMIKPQLDSPTLQALF
jgi:hypothetical protein